MYAAGAGNEAFFRWFYERRLEPVLEGFDWNQKSIPGKNKIGRNMLAMLSNGHPNPYIVRCCDGLWQLGILDKDPFPISKEAPARLGGVSSAGQRQRSKSAKRSPRRP